MNSDVNGGSCYHCGESIPAGLYLPVKIDGRERTMCCPGCQSVAELISNSGLQAFYQLRTTSNLRPDTNELDSLFTVYNDPAACEDFVDYTADGTATARLLIGGISCAACTWLIEQSLRSIPGVLHATVNLAQHTLSVRWRTSSLELGQIFQHLQDIGYQPLPWEHGNQSRMLLQEQRAALSRLAVAGLAMMQVGMFAVALHAGQLQGIADEYRSLLRWVSLLVATTVVFYSAQTFFTSAWINLRQRQLVMDSPVALAIGIAYGASFWATITNTGSVYFDSVAMFTFFLLLGRYLERHTRQRDLLRQTDLQSLLPATAQRKSGPGWQNIPRRQIRSGDVLLLAPGLVIPADGTLREGSASIDESAFSGEEFPRSVVAGERVTAGTLVLEGCPVMEVSATGQETRIGKMLATLTEGQHSKPRLVQLADRIAGRFVALVLLASALVAYYWWQQEPAQALWVTLSVLVVSCPCALALATPAALANAANQLRRRGLLLVESSALDAMWKADTVVFDKTGTLTEGCLERLQSVVTGDATEFTCLRLAKALETASRHPIARAFGDISDPVEVDDLTVEPGCGVSGLCAGERHYIGNERWCRQANPDLVAAPADTGHWIALTTARKTLAWFELRDNLRPESAGVIDQLKKQGMRCELLTGDGSDQGRKLVEALAMDAGHYGYSPEQKLEYIQHLQAHGHRVIMVGDGLNDAPVLAAANCSIAVNEATDLAKAQADCILLNRNLNTVLTALEIAGFTRRVIRQNLAWALAYNLIALPLAAGGLIAPWLAAVGMSASSLMVVGNSLRLNQHS